MIEQPPLPDTRSSPDLVKIPLRDYQRNGLDWLVWLERNELGGILADDMGLGKTVQVLALLAERPEGKRRPSIVVAPRSVVFNWLREAERFANRRSPRNSPATDGRHS